MQRSPKALQARARLQEICRGGAAVAILFFELGDSSCCSLVASSSGLSSCSSSATSGRSLPELAGEAGEEGEGEGIAEEMGEVVVESEVKESQVGRKQAGRQV